MLLPLVLGSQPARGDSGWPVHEGPSDVVPETGKLRLHHTALDASIGLRVYFPLITVALKGAHQDALQADGRGLLLKYVATYVPKFSDSFAQEWLSDDASDGYELQRANAQHTQHV